MSDNLNFNTDSTIKSYPVQSNQNLNFTITIPSNIKHNFNPSTLSTHNPRVEVKAANSWIADVWNQCLECLKNLWNSLTACLGLKTNGSTTDFNLVINPAQHAHHINNPNKRFVYDRLLQGRTVAGQVTMSKSSLNDTQALEAKAVFPPARTPVVVVNGTFLYDASTADTVHWTANFADPQLFGFCEGPLLAQDELQVLEHPALAHAKNALAPHQRTLQNNDVALFQNVPRLGALDTTTPLTGRVPPQTLYGNYFAQASSAEISSRLTRFDNPVASNIYAIVGSNIPLSLNGHPYLRKDLEKPFFTLYNAAQAIKTASPDKTNIMHNGNWAMGAFGNDPKTMYLLILAAARFAGVDELRMYPMTNQIQLEAATQLLAQIEQQFPQMTAGQFLDHLTANAARYGLRYGLGNGT